MNQFMQAALDMAQLGRGQTHTNPLVGAVVVHDQQIIAAGAHLIYGQAHAERNAIHAVAQPEVLNHSILYVTLEPCNHTGKQPPCSHLIVASGIPKVVIAQTDPHPIVQGKGIAYLRAHGVTVESGIMQTEARALNPFYTAFYEQGRPYVTLKQAVTLDGRLTAKADQTTAITGPDVWQKVHQERQNYQGILVGSQTVLTDDPSLLPEPIGPWPPVRLILDRRGRLFGQTDLALWQDDRAPVYLFTADAKAHQVPAHWRVFVDDDWTIAKVLAQLTKLEIQSIYVEGGAQIQQAFLQSNLWDDCISYVAPKLLGSGLPAFTGKLTADFQAQLQVQSVTQIGDDLRIQAKKVTTCSQD